MLCISQRPGFERRQKCVHLPERSAEFVFLRRHEGLLVAFAASGEFDVSVVSKKANRQERFRAAQKQSNIH